MTLMEILGGLAIALACWFLWDSLKAREAANAAMRAACAAQGLLFLDDTVALDSLWPVRNDDGHLRLRRIYKFEYSDTGHNRRRGHVTMLGDAVSALSIALRQAHEISH